VTPRRGRWWRQRRTRGGVRGAPGDADATSAPKVPGAVFLPSDHPTYDAASAEVWRFCGASGRDRGVGLGMNALASSTVEPGQQARDMSTPALLRRAIYGQLDSQRPPTGSR
jgi:hypothetical protein